MIAKNALGEKDALESWDASYHAQAQLYMHYTGMTRHYLTCGLPGARDRVVSVRTDYNSTAALRLVALAGRVVRNPAPPPRISDKPDHWVCRWCDHHAVRHGAEPAARTNCRTCVHATPARGGAWVCERFDTELAIAEQLESCPAHLTIPDLVPGQQVDDGDRWIAYVLPSGQRWIDGEAPLAAIADGHRPTPKNEAAVAFWRWKGAA